ncbi:DUF3099 domain-containing protein [Streptomyces sp. NPDC005574]|uniref:DUF3099 domain-containing protein n=1 Tax=Streptomyces sp. NPDC005574 TaxID=3156891 RepID=UPI0033BE839F
MRKQHGDGAAQVFRITGARTGLQEDVRGRQRRYVISMSIRTLSVILAVALWNVERHVAIVALVLGAVLPYISVVIANAGRENAPSLPSAFASAASRLGTPPALPVGGRVTSSRPDERDTAPSSEDAAGGAGTASRSAPDDRT